MALPNTIDPTLPAGTDSPAQGDDQLRGIKQYVIDVLGVPNAVAVTAAASAISAAGLVTISQSPLTVPTEIQGGTSQFLQLRSQYSSMHFIVQGASLMTLSQTGMLLRQPFLEFPSGVTGLIGTQSTNPLYLQTQGQPRWLVDQSGMLLGSTDNVVDIGALGVRRPRNVYVASNLIVGGQIMSGSSQIILTGIDGSLANTVTTNTAQTISGVKTFSAAPIVTSATGLLWTAGAAGQLGTTDNNLLAVLTNNASRWQFDASGMLRATTDNVVDVGLLGAQRPRNVYVASNVIVGGMIQAGAAPFVITTPTGMLDLTKGTVAGEVRGDVLTRQATTWSRIAAGLSGTFFQSAGSGADPAWVAGVGGVTQGQNPVAWTGGHSWSAPTFLLTNAAALTGIGVTVATRLLHVGGLTFIASNLHMGGQIRLDVHASGRLVLPVGSGLYAS